MRSIYVYTLAAATFLACADSPSSAQQINKKALEKANWYVAPREFQILDDRPVVRDLRDQPVQSQNVNLGGPGARAGGDGTVPSGGMHFGQPGVRTPTDNLPKSTFGSNIPSAGMVPASALPRGGLTSYTRGGAPAVGGNLPSGAGRSYVPRRVAPTGMVQTRAPKASNVPAVVKSYGSGYGSSIPAAKSYAATSEELRVRGKLLKSR